MRFDFNYPTPATVSEFQSSDFQFWGIIRVATFGTAIRGRVRTQGKASKCSAISVATCSRVFILECVAPIHVLIALNGCRVTMETILNTFQHGFAFPASDAAFFAGRVLIPDWAGTTHISPVNVYDLVGFRPCHSGRQMLARWTNVYVIECLVDKVMLGEASIRPRI